MFPGGMNPKQMKTMMARMGIMSDDVDATTVVIHGTGKDIIIENPEVVKLTMQGQLIFNITGGKVREEAAKDESDVSVEISEEDVKIVAEQTGASHEAARAALVDTRGDLAEAIMKLKG